MALSYARQFGRGSFLLHIVRHVVYTVGSVDCRVVRLQSCRRYGLQTPTITQRVLKRIPGKFMFAVGCVALCRWNPILTRFRDTFAAKCLKADRARGRRTNSLLLFYPTSIGTMVARPGTGFRCSVSEAC